MDSAIKMHIGINIPGITAWKRELSLSLLEIFPEGICFVVFGENVDDDLLNKILCVKERRCILTYLLGIYNKKMYFFLFDTL